MSAFMLDHAHLNALLSFGARHDTRIAGDGDHLTAQGRTLLLQNMRSVAALYGEQIDPEQVEAYRFKFAPELSPVEILKACNCYDYQACETDDYRQTDAAKLVAKIRSLATDRLPGYRAARWTIND